jgi:hypothetical protein
VISLENLSVVAETIRPDVTNRPPGSPISPLRVKSFSTEEIVYAPNYDDADQTVVRSGNGASDGLRIDLGQFLLSLPPSSDGLEYFRAIQKWEGHVIQVGKDSFSARLIPIAGEGPDQEAEIYMEEVAPDDRSLVEPGAVFYWSIGYLDKPSGTRLRASVLRFRRLPVWTQRELENATIKADELRDLLDVDK